MSNDQEKYSASDLLAASRLYADRRKAAEVTCGCAKCQENAGQALTKVSKIAYQLNVDAVNGNPAH